MPVDRRPADAGCRRDLGRCPASGCAPSTPIAASRIALRLRSPTARRPSTSSSLGHDVPPRPRRPRRRGLLARAAAHRRLAAQRHLRQEPREHERAGREDRAPDERAVQRVDEQGRGSRARCRAAARGPLGRTCTEPPEAPTRSATPAGRPRSPLVSREAKIAPNTATPTEPPIERKNCAVDVAAPMSPGGASFWTTSTSTCITRPMPTPMTTMYRRGDELRRVDAELRQQRHADGEDRRAGDRERAVAPVLADPAARQDRRASAARPSAGRAAGRTASGSRRGRPAGTAAGTSARRTSPGRR